MKSVQADAPLAIPYASLKIGLCMLFVVGAYYGLLFSVSKKVMYSQHITPLSRNASLDQYSEGRVMNHIWHLAGEIGIRQEGSPGLIEAANYLKSELQTYKKRTTKDVRVEIDETFVNGSFSMHFLGYNISLAYRNHINIAIRIAAADAREDAASVLVNGHFDSPLGSPGAADCASCVASMLEAVRFIIDTHWVPPSPIIFLFNGAEELFLLASHGFMTTHKWRSSLGALINIENSGAGGLDVLCQSGPGSWVSQIYAKSVVYPMATSAAQDVFRMIPGDTDYRIFSKDYGDVPGLDIIMALEGYFYHTPYDTPDRIVPGSMQMRGENLISLLRGFTNASGLQTSEERAESREKMPNIGEERRAVFFDFLTWFMVYYSHDTAMALHLFPLGILLLIPNLTTFEESGIQHASQRVYSIVKGLMLHVLALFLGLICPVILAITSLAFSSRAMTWFPRPWLAILIYAPISLVGLLLPQAIFEASSKNNVAISGHNLYMKALFWKNFWGTCAYHALTAAIGTYYGLPTGFSSFWCLVFTAIALPVFKLACKYFGQHSPVSSLAFIIPLTVPTLFFLYFGGLLWQIVEEKMGMAGTVPQPYGFFFADTVMAVMTGLFVFSVIGPILPVVGTWLSNVHILQILTCLSIGSAIISTQMFPYTLNAPKRVVLQHTFRIQGDSVLESSYDISVLDANPLSFIFKQAPVIAERLGAASDFKENNALQSPGGTFLALHPIPNLLAPPIKFQQKGTRTIKPIIFPHLHLHKIEHQEGKKSRRIHLELDLGSLQEVWSSVINVTGSLKSWSFTDQKLPDPDVVGEGGKASFSCRLSGRDPNRNWNFWLEANGTDDVRVDLAVLDQQMEAETKQLIDLFPPWTAVVAATGYLSSYQF